MPRARRTAVPAAPPGVPGEPDLPLPRLVIARRFASAADALWHVHDAHELVLVTRGRCEIQCGDRVMHGGVGTLFVLPQGLPQYQRSHGFTGTSYICFTASVELFHPFVGTMELPPGQPAARWIEDLCDLDADPAADRQAACQGLLLAVLGWLRQAHRASAGAESVHPALVRASGLITQRLARVLDLPRLADEVGVSAVHLSRLFRARYGCGPLRWQQRLRLRAAERLLTTTDRPLAEVARACGYDDVGYFVRLFRLRYRVTPGRWRQRGGG